MKTLLLFLIRLYQVALSPWLGGACRYVPSCSVYARDAVARHGAARGLGMALRRLARCHPLARHPFHDPVPPAPAAEVRS